MKKETTTQTKPQKDLKSLSDIQPISQDQASELKGGYYYYCCTDKRRPIRVRYSSYSYSYR